MRRRSVRSAGASAAQEVCGIAAHRALALARDGVWEFCYVGLTNKIAGTAAGFAMRPIALR